MENKSSEKEFRVRRGRVDSISIYEVKEDELEILENGAPVGIYLNFAVFLLSIAFSGITALATAKFDSILLENAVLFTSIVGVVVGVLLLFLWKNEQKSIKSTIQKIKDRVPPDIPVQENIYTEANSPQGDNDFTKPTNKNDTAFK